MAEQVVLDPASVGIAPPPEFQPEPLPPPSPFSEGWSSGVEGLKASLAGAAAAVAGGFGARSMEHKALEYAKEHEARAGESARKVEDISGVGDAFDYAKWAMGNIMPSSLAFLGTAAAGRGFGAFATRNAALAATRDFAKNTGAAVGGMAASTILEAGQIYPDAVESGVANPLLRTAIGAPIAALGDLAPDYLIAKRLGLFGAKRAMQDVVGKGGWKGAALNAAKDTAIVSPLEGFGETYQAVVERAAAGKSLNNSEAMSDYINSFFPGLIGGAMTIPGSAVAGYKGPIRQQVQGDVPRGTNLQEVPPASGGQGPATVQEVPGGVPTGASAPVQGDVAGGAQASGGAVVRERVPEAGAAGGAVVSGLPGSGAQVPSGLGSTAGGGVAVPPVPGNPSAFGHIAEANAARESLHNSILGLTAELGKSAKERGKGRTKQAITSEIKAAQSQIEHIDAASELLPSGEGAPIEQHAPYLNAVAERDELHTTLRSINDRLEAANQLKPEFRAESPEEIKALGKQRKDARARLDVLDKTLAMVRSPQSAGEAFAPLTNEALPNFPTNDAEARLAGHRIEQAPAQGGGETLMSAARPRLDRDIAEGEQAIKQRRTEVEAAYAQREDERHRLASAQAADQNLERDVRVGNVAGAGVQDEVVPGAMQAALEKAGLGKGSPGAAVAPENADEKAALANRLSEFDVHRKIRAGKMDEISDEQLMKAMRRASTTVQKAAIKEMGSRLEFEAAGGFATPAAPDAAPEQVASPSNELPPTPEPPKKKANPRNDPFLRWIIKSGGIDSSYAEELTGEKGFVANNVVPGLFKRRDKHNRVTQAHGLDDIATRAIAEHWMPASAGEDVDGGVAAVTQMISAALSGERAVHMSNEQAAFEKLQAKHEADLQSAQKAHEAAYASLGKDQQAQVDYLLDRFRSLFGDEHTETVLERIAMKSEGDSEEIYRAELKEILEDGFQRVGEKTGDGRSKEADGKNDALRAEQSHRRYLPDTGDLFGPTAADQKDKPVGNAQRQDTAPEHARNVGKALDDKIYEPVAKGNPPTIKRDTNIQPLTIDKEAFKEITDEWSVLFADPEAKVITEHRAKKEPYISVEEAQQRIDGWKAHARAQKGNSNRTVLSLFDLTGEWSKPWREAGYNVITFDIQNGADIMDFSAEYFNENYDFGEVYAILAACPCTDFAVSGAKHFAGKDADGRTEASKELVFQTLRTIEYFRPPVWSLENPVGRIEKLTGLPKSRMTFDPNHFGAPYTKKTVLWGKFNAELPLAHVDPVEGSKMWSKYGGKSQATKNARSETPEGFAYAYFMANNYNDLPAERRLMQDYPEVSGAVREAYKAGVSEEKIRDLMENTYGNYEYDEALQALDEAATEAIKSGPKPEQKTAVRKNESDQEKSEREFGENYNRVVNSKDFKDVSDKDLMRAASYGARAIAFEKRKGWDGKKINDSLISSMQVDLDAIRAEEQKRGLIGQEERPSLELEGETPEQLKAKMEQADREDKERVRMEQKERADADRRSRDALRNQTDLFNTQNTLFGPVDQVGGTEISQNEETAKAITGPQIDLLDGIPPSELEQVRVPYVSQAPKLHRDNPGGQWLKDEQALNKQRGRGKHGEPDRFGPVTAAYREHVLVPMSFLSKLPGISGEHKFDRQSSLDYLEPVMKERGRLPRFSEDSIRDYAPFIQVNQDGEIWVSEGNHRIKVAKKLGWKYLPIELRYFSGGELAKSNLSPEKINEYHDQALAEGFTPESYSGTGNAPKAEQPKDTYTSDLFGAALPSPAQAIERENRIARQSFPTGEIPGAKFGTVVEPVVVGQLRTGFGQVTTPAEAAHTLAALRKSPQEKFIVLMLDAANKPIAAAKLFAGAIGETSVHPEVLVKAVYQTPNVAKIWFAHNHPSGLPSPSMADMNLTERLQHSFGPGTGVEVQGHIVIAGDRYAVMDRSGSVVPPGLPEKIPAAARTISIPITERTIKVGGKLLKGYAFNSPEYAKQQVPLLLGGNPGVVFMDTQNRVVATLNMATEEMKKLRQGIPDSSAKKFFLTAGRSNAAGMIVYVPGEMPASLAVNNIAAAANSAQIRVMDVMHGDRSYATLGIMPDTADIHFNSRDAVAQAYDDRAMRYDAIGQEITSYLDRILGGSPDLQVGMFEQRQPGGFAGRISMSGAKDIIQIALNAKTPLSVAAHEGFHRIEMRHLNGQDRAVVARGIAKGTAMHTKTLEIAKGYDEANGTDLADEIAGNDREARAYGFQFWREGKLEADGAIAKVFQKISQFLERVGNFIAGYGFKSIDDIFEAIERGHYAKSDKAVFVQTAREAYGELEDQSRDLWNSMIHDKAGTIAPLWYSALQRNVENLKLNSASPQQWKGTIKSLTQKGVKSVEIDETGVYDWLDMQEEMNKEDTKRAESGPYTAEVKKPSDPDANHIDIWIKDKNGKVIDDYWAPSDAVAADVASSKLAYYNAAVTPYKIPREELVSYLKEKGVKVTETMLGAEGVEDATNEINSLTVELDAAGYTVINDAITETFGVERRSDKVFFGNSDQMYSDEFGADVKEHYRSFDELPTLIADKVNRLSALLEASQDEYDSRDSDNTRFSRYTLPGGKDYRELLLTLPASRTWLNGKPISDEDLSTPHGRAAANRVGSYGPEVFRSSHFDEPNILAHVRFKERADVNGKRVLFIEEIQSDWAQKGKRQGFKKNVPAVGAKSQFEVVQTEHQYLVTDPVSGYKVDPGKGTVGSEEAARDYAAKYFAAKTSSAVAAHVTAVPPSPFVGKTEAWVALALKRMIRYAAENGFDSVAMTDGEQQADRYDLSKQVSRVEASLPSGGGFAVYVYRNKEDTVPMLQRRVETENELANLIGKELAGKIAAQPKGTKHNYTDIDLKVGGEGMREFYDKIIPNVANDVLKKLGGGKMSTVQISEPGQNFKLIPGKGQQDYIPTATMAQPGFEITQALRDNVLQQGVPLFSKDAINRLSGGDIDRINSGMPGAALYSNAALEGQALRDIARRVQAGELPHTQLMAAIGTAIENTKTPDSTFARLFNDVKAAFKGGIGRAYLSHFSTGNNVARYSAGYKNVFDVVTAYNQSKSRSIAENLDIGMSKWKPWDVKIEDSKAAGHFLMDRTSKNWKVDSPEYLLAFSALNDTQKEMVKQANTIVPAMLMAEYEADKTGYRAALNDDDYAKWEANRMQQIQRLIDEGYVPERRYGNFGVSVSMPVTQPDGTTKKMQLRYDLFENQVEAEMWYSSLVGTEKEPGPLADSGLTIEKGTRFKPEYDASLSFKQFLDLANRHGVSLTQAEREKIAKAMITADSTRRNRIFQRKNIPGFSEDATRVLSEFIVNVSNKVAYAQYGNAIQDALQGKQVTIGWANGKPTMQVDQNTKIWSNEGENSGYYHGEAEKMVNAVVGPQEDNKWTRIAKMGATMGFLGGSIAFVPVQLSSIPINVVPYLTKSTSYTNALAVAFSSLTNTVTNSGTLFDLAKLSDKKNVVKWIDDVPGFRDALIRAGEDGTTFDTELYQLMGMTRGGLMTKSRVTQKAAELWMKPFTWSEKANRISTFTSAYKIGTENGLKGDELYKFAQQAVFDTQIRYDMANRPAVMRNPIYALLFTFKTYPIAMGELIWNLFKEDKTAGVAMLGSLWLFAGLNGLPFRENLMDFIDTIAQRMFGQPFNSERWLRHHLKNASEAVAGTDLSGVFLNGLVNSLTDLNMQSRVGLHNLIPGSRIGAVDVDWQREATQMLGPLGSQFIGAAKGVGSMLKGDFIDAMKQGGPTAMQNAIKGIEQFQKGYAVDSKGQKLQDVNMFNAAMQFIGFSNASLASAYDLDRIDKQTWAYYTAVRGDFIKDITKAVQSGDRQKVQDITALLTKWNENNPEMPIKLNASSLRRHIQQAGMPIEKRTLLRLPQRLRAGSFSHDEVMGE